MTGYDNCDDINHYVATGDRVNRPQLKGGWVSPSERRSGDSKGNMEASPTPDPPPSLQLEPGANVAVGLLGQELLPLTLGQVPPGHLAGEAEGSFDVGVPSVDPAVVRRDGHVVGVADELGAGRDRIPSVRWVDGAKQIQRRGVPQADAAVLAPETSSSPSSE